MIGHRIAVVAWLTLLCSCAGGDGAPTQAVGDASVPAEKSPAPAATFLPFAGEQWIEVILDRQTVILHDGDSVAGEFTASTGVGTSRETTTYPGEFRVQTMMPGPVESSPGVYVTDVVIFDLYHGNGFHSRLMDKDGNILDATLGKPATAGCIRLAESGELYRFARLGMRVVVH